MFFTLSVLAALLKIGGASVADSRALAFSPPEQTTAVEVTSEQRTETTVTSGAETTSHTGIFSRTGTALRTGTKARVLSREPSISKSGAAAMISDRPDKKVSAGKPPVFYRPARKSHGASSTALQGPVCGDLSDAPKGSKAIFPLADTYFNSYDDTWGAPRPQGGHEGTDLMAPAGNPEYAVTDGTVVPVSGSNGNGWNTLGGYTVMVRSDYDFGPIRAGDIFYYAHMNKPTALKPGTRVRAGQIVGFAGDTGQGPEITRGLFPSHLHFGWYDTNSARSSLDSGAMNPFPLLEWLKSNGGAVTGGSGARYCQVPQSGPPVPSTGGDTWNFPSSPGERPDLDTGSDKARPSPVVERSDTSAERAPGVAKSELPEQTTPENFDDSGKDTEKDVEKNVAEKVGRKVKEHLHESGDVSRDLRDSVSEAPTGPTIFQRPDISVSSEKTSGNGQLSSDSRRAVHRKTDITYGRRIKDIVQGVVDRVSGHLSDPASNKPSRERTHEDREKRHERDKPGKEKPERRTAADGKRSERSSRPTSGDTSCDARPGDAQVRGSGEDEIRDSNGPCEETNVSPSSPSSDSEKTVQDEPDGTVTGSGGEETSATPEEDPPPFETTTPPETTLVPETEAPAPAPTTSEETVSGETTAQE